MEQRNTWALWLGALVLTAGCTLPREEGYRPRVGFDEARPDRIVAAQVLFLDLPSLAEVEAVVEDLERRGVNTVIWRAFQNPGDRVFPLVDAFAREGGVRVDPGGAACGVYFDNRVVPVTADLLAPIAEIVHARGMRFWAWMTTKYMDCGIDAPGGMKNYRYDFARKEPVPARGLDLFSETALERLETIYRDLAAQPIDGILFQDDMILGHTEGFSPLARSLFERHFGRGLDAEALYIGPYRDESGKFFVTQYSELFWTWSRWKASRISAVADRLTRAARGVKPGLTMAANFHYEVASKPRWALAWFSQDLDMVKEAGLDYASVMVYHRQIGEELSLGKGETLDVVGEMARALGSRFRRPERVIVKLQIADWHTGEPLDPAEVGRYAARVLKEGSFSLAFVPYSAGYPVDEVLSRKGRRRLR